LATKRKPSRFYFEPSAASDLTRMSNGSNSRFSESGAFKLAEACSNHNLVGVLARGSDQICDVSLRQSDGGKQVPIGKRPSVPFGESENPARDAGFDLECGERLDLFVGRTQTRRERAGQVAGERRNRRQAVTKIYSLATRQYQQITTSGSDPVWLSDNRRLLFIDKFQLYLVDSRARQAPRKIMSLDPLRIVLVTPARDNRQIYLSVISPESDIQMLSLK